MKRILLISIGLVAVGLAIIGIWVPGLPTTPFLILALWAFAGSSKRLHDWLLKAPIFKNAMKHVKNFEEKRAVEKKVKIVSQTFAWGSFLLTLYFNGFGFVSFLVFIAALSCSVAMYKIPAIKE